MPNDPKTTLEPAILVIFGITGDLAKRKLLPALYHLVKDDLLHEQTEIIGTTRQQMTLDELMQHIELCVNEVDGVCDPETVRKLHGRLSLRRMDMTDDDAYDELLKHLNKIEDKHGVHMNRLYYLSIPPAVAQPIITFLGKHGLNTSCQHGEAKTRLLLEKPFGYSLESAKELIEATAKYFSEEQIFRIDHYLAKETVQNLLTFRYNNPIFEPLWDSQHISSIEVVAKETIGIEGRANFYEQTGALRDLIQSHLLQVLALVTMEQPHTLTSAAIHSKKEALLKSVSSIKPDRVQRDTIRGQYKGYWQEVDNPESLIETFAALKLQIDNLRWNSVPILIRTGKALDEKFSRVAVTFKPTKQMPHHNILTFRLQPNEGIELSLRVKRPGYDETVDVAEMNFDYEQTFHTNGRPNAYERVLVDTFRGDQTLFASSAEVLESWRIVQHVLNEWQKNDTGLFEYDPGSTGPSGVAQLLGPV